MFWAVAILGGICQSRKGNEGGSAGGGLQSRKEFRQLSSELGCPRASSVNEIMENADIDAVIIATPNYLHHQHVLAAAERESIFSVKPFALTQGRPQRWWKHAGKQRLL